MKILNVKILEDNQNISIDYMYNETGIEETIIISLELIIKMNKIFAKLKRHGILAMFGEFI